MKPMERGLEIERLATEVAEIITKVAARLITQIIAEVHDSHIGPLKDRISRAQEGVGWAAKALYDSQDSRLVAENLAGVALTLAGTPATLDSIREAMAEMKTAALTPAMISAAGEE